MATTNPRDVAIEDFKRHMTAFLDRCTRVQAALDHVLMLVLLLLGALVAMNGGFFILVTVAVLPCWVIGFIVFDTAIFVCGLLASLWVGKTQAENLDYDIDGLTLDKNDLIREHDAIPALPLSEPKDGRILAEMSAHLSETLEIDLMRKKLDTTPDAVNSRKQYPLVLFCFVLFAVVASVCLVGIGISNCGKKT